MDRRLFLGTLLTYALGSGCNVSDSAAAPSTYKLPFGRIAAGSSSSLSGNGRYASMPLSFRPDNEIAFISFDDKLERRLVFSEWVQAIDTALNHDGSRLAVVCWNNYVESTIVVIDTATFAIIETISTPLDIYLRPVYWEEALFYARTVPLDQTKLVMRYPPLAGPDRYHVWKRLGDSSTIFLDSDLPKPIAIDLIDGKNFIYRCDFHEAFHTPNIARYKTADGHPMYALDGFAPMSIMATSNGRVYIGDSEK